MSDDVDEPTRSAPEIAAELETTRQRRAQELAAAQVEQVAQVARRIGGVEDRAVETAMRTAAAATDVETARERRAAELAVEAYAARRAADELQGEVRALTTDVNRLSLASARVETELAKLNDGIGAVLSQTKAMRENYNLDDTAPLTRHWLPLVLQWFEQMMTLTSEGVSRLALIDELIAAHLARKHTSRARKAAFLVVLPLLGALLVAFFSWLLARYYPAPR
jgi:hypothetical protein